MLFTIGHSNRSWPEFLELLKKNKISTLADIRHYPGSKTVPQYNKETMEKNLANEGIRYIHIIKLGGRRKPDGTDRNAGWENDAFRGYADYMVTDEFKEGIAELLALKGNIAIMCAEAVPWRCHRRLVADYLTVHKHQVYEIISTAEPKLHKLTEFAKVKTGVLSYPSAQQRLA